MQTGYMATVMVVALHAHLKARARETSAWVKNAQHDRQADNSAKNNMVT